MGIEPTSHMSHVAQLVLKTRPITRQEVPPQRSIPSCQYLLIRIVEFVRLAWNKGIPRLLRFTLYFDLGIIKTKDKEIN